MDDFRELLEKAHSMGIRVIMDMILNHTSNQHPWFVESASSPVNRKRDWYIWKPENNGRMPNNWRSAVGGSAWKFDFGTGEYYLHSFFEEQPDLNWRNPEVAEAFFSEMKFWLDMGVDGFRFDVINMIAKDKKFRNNPLSLKWPLLQEHVYTRNRQKSVKIVHSLRKLLDGYADKVGIGEVYTMPPGNAANAAKYLANGEDGLHLAFDFSLIFSSWNAHSYYKCISNWYDSLPDSGWPCQVLSNHDLFRNIDRFPWRFNKAEKAKVAAVLLLTLKGTPFIYYGEEIGMQNTQIKKSDIRDPMGKRFWPLFSGRDKARTPMQWNSGPNGGFTSGKPWLPMNRDFRYRNVKHQEGDNESMLNHYRKLIQIRKEFTSLTRGDWVPQLNGKNGVLAYYRIYRHERTLIVLNFTGKYKQLSISDFSYGRVLLSGQRSGDEYFYFQNLRIFPFEATIFLVEEKAEIPH
jgi:alpha-glucosidase